MKKIYLVIFLLVTAVIRLFAQCTGTQLTWVNPCFNGTAGTVSVTPPPWNVCQPGTTPDTQPGCWGVTLPPASPCSVSYVGMCNEPSGNWYEGCGEQLSTPMVAGTTYTFTMDLATTNSTGGGLTPGPIEIQVWGNMGGNSGCDETFLCWSSGNVTNTTWQVYTCSFTATQNWTNLLFMSHNIGSAYCPYIMLDNLSPVSPVADIAQFTWTNVCIGDSMVFTDKSTSLGTITTWDWDWGDGTAHGNTATPSPHLYSAAGTFNVSLTITSTVPCTTKVTHQVIVNPLPTASITPPVSSTCSGSSVSLTANGGTTYSWSPSSGLSSVTISNPTANPTIATTYTVTCTDANGCSNTASCIGSINSAPILNITASANPVCIGYPEN